MIVGFDGKRIFHNWRGLGNYSRDLVTGLKNFYPGNEYKLFTPSFTDKRAIAFQNNFGKSNIITPSGFWGRAFPSLWRRNLSSALIDEKIDIFHGLSHEIPYGLKKVGIKSVVTIHDLIFLRFPEYFPWIDRKIYYSKVKHAIKNADLVIAICEQTRRDLIELMKCPEDKIEVCYQSCHIDFQQECSQEEVNNIRSRYKLEKDYFLFVGAFEQRKNILNLIEGYSHFGKSRDLILVGRTNAYEAEIRTQIKKFNVENNVKIISNIPHEDLRGLYVGAEIFCFPSFYEGFGIPIIEALFCGTPVITSSGSCFPEVGGDGALYINPLSPVQIAKALYQITNNSELKKRLIKNGWDHVQKFTRRNTSKSMYQIYQKVLDL